MIKFYVDKMEVLEYLHWLSVKFLNKKNYFCWNLLEDVIQKIRHMKSFILEGDEEDVEG